MLDARGILQMLSPSTARKARTYLHRYLAWLQLTRTVGLRLTWRFSVSLVEHLCPVFHGQDSNLLPIDYQSTALPMSYH